MDTLMLDVRLAVRSLATSKLFTLVALISLALGIGANVTVFTIVNALAFKPLPYVEPNRLVDLHEWSATKLCGGCGVGTSYPTFLDWRASARSFTGMGAYLERPFSVSGTETAERVGGAIVSSNVFDLLGVHPTIGRGFQGDDDRIDAVPVVLLSDGLWNRRYGADRRIIGQPIRVNGVAHTVIGVMPPKFKFPEFAELWVPFVPNAAKWSSPGFTSDGGVRNQRQFAVLARLAPGATLATANVELATIAKNLEQAYPESQREWTARATSLYAAFGAVPASMYAVLLGAVGFVLLIVCANLAGLVLARGTMRQREIAIRLALGATRPRIVRHLLTESLMLSIAGGALGLIVAMWGRDLAVRSIGARAPFYVDFSVDGWTVAFCLGMSILTAVLFGLLPALASSRADVQSTLKETSATVRKSYARGVLVIGELALAMILLAGAGELMKSFLRISAPEDGYDERGLLTGNLEFLDAKYHSPGATRIALNAIVDRVQQMPGTVVAASDRFQFIAGFGQGDKVIRVEGRQTIPDGVSPRFYHVVTPGYFSTVRLPIVAGRSFDARDRESAPRVAIINKRLAEALWPGESPLGHRIKLGAADSLPWMTIVGVSGDVSNGGRSRNYAYVPADQEPGATATLLIRANSNSLALVSSLRSAVQTVDPDLPVVDVQTIEQQQHANYLAYETYAIAVGVFAGFAILLAAVGLYGVIAYNTVQRTREIGVRIALGAEARHVIAMVAEQGGRLVVFGVVAGIAGSAALLRVLGAMLFGASPIDIPVFAAVSALLAAVAMVAIWVPARRAARVDPLIALRAE